MTYYFSESLYISCIFVMSIYIFLLFTFFTLLNTFDVRYIKNLSDLKKFGIIFPFNLLFIIVILSFAGIPPLFGFSIKLLVFLLVIQSASIFYTAILALFNFFTLYFYIQNVRYIVNNSKNNYYVYLNNFAHLSDTAMFVLFISLLVNLIGIFYLSDLWSFFAVFAI